MTQASPLHSTVPAPSGVPYNTEAAAVIKHVAHELRQPLSTIESIAFFLETILPDSEMRAREQLAKIQILLEQASAVLGDAIYYVQAAPPRPILLDLNNLISRIRSEEFDDCESFRLELALPLPRIHADLHQMTHLVRALFSLMMRSTDAGAPVVFRTSDAEGEVRLEISCDANLVRPMSLRAFTSSFQTHENQAAGLACASVQRIAEVHGGRVDIQSLDDVFSLRVAFPAA